MSLGLTGPILWSSGELTYQHYRQNPISFVLSALLWQVRSHNNTCQGCIYFMGKVCCHIKRWAALWAIRKVLFLLGEISDGRDSGGMYCALPNPALHLSPWSGRSSLHAAAAPPVATPMASPEGKGVTQTPAHRHLLPRPSVCKRETLQAFLSAPFYPCIL